jgi:hypothetical protein
LYDYLLRAYTYLLFYDIDDYMEEYYKVKGMWVGFIEENPYEDIDVLKEIEEMLDGETWTIEIWYSMEHPFLLNHGDFLEVYFIFEEANPQFFNNLIFIDRIAPVTFTCDVGLTPGISVKAYWALGYRRQALLD